MTRAVRPNIGIERKYKRQLVKLIDEMQHSVKYWIRAGYKKDLEQIMAFDSPATSMRDVIKKRFEQWQKRFDNTAQKLAENFVGNVDEYSKRSMRLALQDKLPTVNFKETPAMKNALDSFVVENVNLIKSIPQKYFTEIEGIVMRSVRDGRNLADLTNELEHRYDITRKRAILIATDQNNKATETLNRVRVQELGVTKAKWIHTGGSKEPRKSHQHANGKIFELDKGCLIDGEYIYPGQLINCYHKDTEVMTKRGFVKFYDLTPEDLILTLNPETKNLEYSRIKHFIKKYSEDVVRIKGRTLDMCVDPQHTFFAYREKERNRKIVVLPEFVKGIENLRSKTKFYKSSEWVGIDKKYITINGKQYDTEVFCKFLAYYLSEGSIDKRPHHYSIRIAQETYVDKMYEDLKSLGARKNKKVISITDKNLHQYVAKFGYSYEKYIPDEIKELSKKYLRIFLDAYALGDGQIKQEKECCGHKAYVYNRYFTSSKKMRNDLIECIIKSGMSASCDIMKVAGKVQKFRNGTYTINNDIFLIFELKKKFDQLSTAKVQFDKYNDYLYDIEVEKNNTLLTRFNKCIIWNGNCKCTFEPIIEGFD